MLPTLELTKVDGEVFYLPAGEIKRIESKGEGSYVITANASYACKNSAKDVSGSYNTAIKWREGLVVNAQIEAAARMHEQAQRGLLVPTGAGINGN